MPAALPHLIVATRVNAAALEGSEPVWVQLIVTTGGEVVRNGRWQFALDDADLEAYASSIRENAERIPLDYDHPEETDGDTRAAGWFTGETAVLAKGDARPTPGGQGAAVEPELWAEVGFTPRAAQEVRDGEYRFLSPEFSFHERDKSGVLRRAKEILAASLTNRPFFRMQPVAIASASAVRAAVTAADVVWRETAGFEWLRQQIHRELNGPNDEAEARYWVQDVAPGRALVQEWAEGRTFVVPYAIDDEDVVTVADPDEWEAAEQQWVEAASRARESSVPFSSAAADSRRDVEFSAEQRKRLTARLGLAEDATDEQIAAALEADPESSTDAGDGNGATTSETAEPVAESKLEEQVAAMRKDVDDWKARATKAELKNAIDDGIRDGRIVPAQREQIERQFATDPEAARSFIAAFPADPVRAQAYGSDAETVSADEPSDDEYKRGFASRFGVSPEAVV